MSYSRFDTLVRLFVRPADRRDLLRGFGAAVGVVGLTSVVPTFDEVAAKKNRHKRKHRHKKKPCPSGQTKCGEICVSGDCCLGAACGEGNCRCHLTTDGDTFCATNEDVICLICANSSECSSGPCVTFDMGSPCCLPACGAV
jgi:hypothetical protein